MHAQEFQKLSELWGSFNKKNSFQIAKSLFKVQEASTFFAWFKIAQGSFELPVLASGIVLSGP